MRTLVWLCGWEKCTAEEYRFSYPKSYGSGSKVEGTAPPSVGRYAVLRTACPRQSAKAAFDRRNGCQKCFCVTFDESNKAYAPYPVLITRIGRKDID